MTDGVPAPAEAPRWPAVEIARRLGLHEPTAQQRRVIEAPLEPSLVIAGAGSGKTETMAARVLWLLANRIVEPGQVLGLTFTRKAAGELAERIRHRVRELSRAGLIDAVDVLDAPVVATYNSYANALYRDNAVVIGREGDGTVLGDAAAWQLARSVVRASTHPGLAALDKDLETVTRAVLAIARGLAEHDAVPAELVRIAQGFRGLVDLPPGGRGAYADVETLAGNVGALEVLVELAADYEQAKQRRGLVEYSDQVALSLRIVQAQPRVAQVERERFRVVLLDEYQDTSVVQTRLLSHLFRGHPVMAVGDPNQSIYGWRGASAGNLDDFARAFDARDRFSLSTSWRNGHRILDVANHVVAPFSQRRDGAVERLEPGPAASARDVECRFEETVVEEAAAAARWLRDRLAEADGAPPTAALLLRTRRTQSYFLEALREAGVPFHVLGVGGLLAEPEVADLVCALTVVHDAAAGPELLRLLAGSRWRLGLQDLLALRGVASWLSRRDYAQQPLDDDLQRRLRDSTAPGDGGSIVDALDFVATAPTGHIALERISATGLERLRDAGALFARLRARAGLDLPDFVASVMHELQLDLEVAANPHRVRGAANLDALFDALASYLAIDEVASLGGFLSWLREAEHREDLTPRPEPPEPGTVQVLTIHGAKGLEWDHVVVPRLVDKELPGQPPEGSNAWLGFGQFPWPLRGDAHELPAFAWRAATRKELLDERDRFKAAVAAHTLDEERRLAYVAVTRARHGLLLTGSFWAAQATPRAPSRFLVELAEAGLIPALPEASASQSNPSQALLAPVRWPFDPLGGRRPAVEAAAEAVRSAEPVVVGPWAHEVELLLREREVRAAGGIAVRVPDRVAASTFKDYVEAPATTAATLLRPMPQRPYRATRLGTVFHAWVEQRSAFGGDVEELDALPGELDLDDTVDAVDAAQLDRLRATFERSPWAARRPLEVERELHLPFDGRIVVCKIDAVYDRGDGGYEIVDWKTGRAPTDAADLELRQLQLALYRLAFARWKGIDEALVSAMFYFVADDRIVEPEQLYDEDRLVALWRSAVGDGMLRAH